MIELAGLLVCVAGLIVVGGLVWALVENSRDERRHERWRRTRHIRTLEQELGLEPYPLGPLDAPDVPTASPVVPTERASTQEHHDRIIEEARATLAQNALAWRELKKAEQHRALTARRPDV